MPTDTFEIASASDDGSGYKTGGGYPPTGGYVAEDGTATWAWKAASEVDCGYARWDTSSLSGATISSATLRVYVTSKTDTDSRNYVGDYYDFGGEASVEADWTASPSADAFSVTVASMTLSDWNEITLSSPDSNINKSGYTGIRFAISGGAGTGTNAIAIASYENDPALAPELVVTYTTGGGASKTLTLLGVGG